MPIPRSQRLRWQPKGCSDSLDANNSFPGAMAQLVNLIPDPSTNDSWVSRPNAVQLTNFTGFSTPGFVSAELIVGNIAYGMIASARNSGKDEPYAYNILTNTFETISGVLSSNVPTSPATTGDWTPPILAAFNSRIMVTHPGFPGGATKIGWLDISGFSDNTHTGNTHGTTTVDNLSANVLQAGWQPGMTIIDSAGDITAGTTIVSIASNGLSLVLSVAATGGGSTGTTFTVTGGTATAPLWGAGDLNLNNLPSVPVAVANFNERAYYACGINGIVFSDSGLPTNRTNASQAITPSNGLAVTALGPTYLGIPLTGGSVAALYAFQGISNIIQIQGDPALSNLTTSVLPVNTGTLSPLSITTTNQGLAFISPEGLRLINPSGQVTDPIGDAGTGVSVPFLNALHPSRTCGASNADTMRFSVQRGDVGGNPTQEWWFDLTRKVWSGPHTFPMSQLQPWMDTFVGVATGINAKLWQSDAVPSSVNTFVENGTQMSLSYQTVLLPDDQDMMMTAVIETTITLAPGAAGVTVAFYDDNNVLLDQVFISGGTASLWDVATWDQSTWDNTGSVYRQRRVDWHVPLVFKQGYMQITGNCDPVFRIGNTSLRYQRLGYQQQVA